MPRFLTAATRKSLRDAIASIEAASSAELVIAIRGRARQVAAPAIAIGIAVAVATLALALTTALAPWQILLLPIAAGGIGAAIAQLAPVERLLVSPAVRRAQVATAAHAAFYERGVHRSSRRTGVLVFVALHEQVVELVGDLAAVAAIGQPQLDAWGAELAAALARTDDALAAALAGLAPRFAAVLPHHAGEANELADDVVDVAR